MQPITSREHTAILHLIDHLDFYNRPRDLPFSVGTPGVGYNRKGRETVSQCSRIFFLKKIHQHLSGIVTANFELPFVPYVHVNALEGNSIESGMGEQEPPTLFSEFLRCLIVCPQDRPPLINKCPALVYSSFLDCIQEPEARPRRVSIQHYEWFI